ncbi:MBL fold metallo-hydrolase [Micromonospora sp. KC213]|uniref:MBL fold metallo-hydrolase n=1 Tax=Micromonospora sp. KC213 TaxID=2530378 RepID=UPI001045FFC4|nr:MBL fold metallo-hydrolase [Micromonospora sp. KC213]TDC44051.1 MBL fold metallo-hydrolase [Micromonospora sp. KC213]
MSGASEKIRVRVYGGPTTLIEYGGLRFVTDPTFDPPGEYPMPLPGDHRLVKTAPAPVTAADLGRVDAVLLSHDEHDDNLDHAGRAFLSQAPVVLTTVSGAGRLGGNARGLASWQTAELTRPDGIVTVTGLPARHGPAGCEPITGDVVGFMLTADDLPPVYVSGDNAALDHVKQIAERFAPVDTAILFLGGARMAFAFDGALLTLDSAQGAEATKMLGARRVVPAHYDSWAHFTEGRNEIQAAFADAGLAGRLDFAR